METPEVAFTGDTTSDFIIDETNIDVLRAKILVLEVNLSNYASLLQFVYQYTMPLLFYVNIRTTLFFSLLMINIYSHTLGWSGN